MQVCVCACVRVCVRRWRRLGSRWDIERRTRLFSARVQREERGGEHATRFPRDRRSESPRTTPAHVTLLSRVYSVRHVTRSRVYSVRHVTRSRGIGRHSPAARFLLPYARASVFFFFPLLSPPGLLRPLLLFGFGFSTKHMHHRPAAAITRPGFIAANAAAAIAPLDQNLS
ncbi:LAQU0S06e03466g1_1 [Lachancea quebecensis]|uniref:LAQU0S06e03466g1_1 n=1 Tax=Lachancea quebecensis TaxID=1654605 RepID=A0A0P1KSH3_9SACH|nr:LAQU0S06e03466g1_1 [Lachancea quebecensis]